MSEEYKERYPNGNLRRLLCYSNTDGVGKLHGVFKEWWEDGTYLRDCYYKNGRRHGEWKRWCDFKDNLVVHCFFKNDRHNGEYKEWHNNGKLYKHCFLKNGEFHGESKQWFSNGDLEVHCFYEHGELYVVWKDVYHILRCRVCKKMNKQH